MSFHSRRDLLKSAALIAAAGPLAGMALAQQQPELLRPPAATGAKADPWKGLKVGVASYTFHSLPLQACIDGIKQVDMHYVSIKDSHLKMDSTTEERKAVVQQFKDAKILPISCGVVAMKNEAAIAQAFDYARDIGVPVIVADPSPAMLATVEKYVKERGIKIAIHNHGPESKDFKSPADVWAAVEKLDPRMGLCIDVGHTKRAGMEPVDAIIKFKDRLYDVHMKDIIVDPSGRNTNVGTEVGRGILDIRGMLQALLDIGFTGHVGFEFEKAAKNPLPGLAESVGYTKGVMSTIEPTRARA
ncbi:MAG TPA: sugar phosphate isomerase/epimerase [Humisphaera sp.]|jgi:sugar phosphate isomerase/epimerase|nr:sugar phosphate isomerase/epimerase [Humisphaera sp.]